MYLTTTSCLFSTTLTIIRVTFASTPQEERKKPFRKVFSEQLRLSFCCSVNDQLEHDLLVLRRDSSFAVASSEIKGSKV